MTLCGVASHRIYEHVVFPMTPVNLKNFQDNKHFIYISMLKPFGVLMVAMKWNSLLVSSSSDAD